jgi:hypothetical protein
MGIASVSLELRVGDSLNRAFYHLATMLWREFE